MKDKLVFFVMEERGRSTNSKVFKVACTCNSKNSCYTTAKGNEAEALRFLYLPLKPANFFSLAIWTFVAAISRSLDVWE